jgi:hypothetical protein
MSHTSANITCVYVPPTAFEHCQMKEPSMFNHLLWQLHHIYDDQWTFDGCRGPKSKTRECIRPVQSVEYFAWITDITAARMQDVLDIGDVLRREQLAMSFNRAACDGILAVTTQLPYMSKVFFFACLDKLANILVQIGRFKDDTPAWKHLTSEQFLVEELQGFVNTIPAAPGKSISEMLKWLLQELRIDGVTPELLRAFRNSHHGYGLRPETVEALFRHSGEINNDITLLATPLLLYVLHLEWIERRAGT